MPMFDAKLPRGAVTPDGPSYWLPPGRMPPPPAVRYWRDAISLGLLVIALPWLLYHLLSNPSKVLASRGAGGVA